MVNARRFSPHFSAWLLTALLLSLALPCSALGQSKPLKHIYIGVSSVSMGNIIIFVAKEAKLYEKYGLYADPVAMRGSGESSKAMIGGSIQFSPIATPTVINAGLSGADLVILGHTLPGVVHAMIVKPEIKRVEDLKGKRSASPPSARSPTFSSNFICARKASTLSATSRSSRSAATRSASARSSKAPSTRRRCRFPATASP